MKNFKSTWIFFGIVALVVGLAIFQNERDKREDTAQADKTQLLADADKDLVEVRIRAKNRELLLKKEDGSWKLIKPVEDLADQMAATSFADSFGEQKIQQTEKSGPEVDWKQYGFEEDGAKQVDLKSSNGKDHHFLVSGRNAFDGRYFIRQGDKLILGETSWASVLARDPKTLRDRKILRSDAPITGIEIQNAKSKIKLSKVDEKWRGPANAKLDPEKIERYIGDWPETVTDGVADNRDKSSKMGEILVNQGNKTTKVTFFGRKLEATTKTAQGVPGQAFEYFVEVSDRPAVYRLNKNVYDKLTSVDETLRDRKWPFDFQLEQVAQVDVQTPEYKYSIKKVDEDWTLMSDDPKLELDKNRLPTFFEKIKNMEADEFVPAKDVKGLGHKKNQIVMKDSGERKCLVSHGATNF